MSAVDVNQLLPPQTDSTTTSTRNEAGDPSLEGDGVGGGGGRRIEETAINAANVVAGNNAPGTSASVPAPVFAPAGGRKRKRHSTNNNSNRLMNPGGGGGGGVGNCGGNGGFGKRQKNKQQNIIVCGGGGGNSASVSITTTAATCPKAIALGAGPGNATGGPPVTNNNNSHNCSNKSNVENYTNNNNNNSSNNNNNNGSSGGGGGGGGAERGSGRNNKKNKINFRNVNGSRARQLQLFPALSKFFLPNKRPRKEIIVPPTKFLLGGNISDPLNLNSLQDDDVVASPKSSPMMTPPKVEVIIPPNIRDPLHLLDPVDSIEYEKQLTSPMKKMMGCGVGGGGKKGPGWNNNHCKKKNRPGRNSNSFQKNAQGSGVGENEGPEAGAVESGGSGGVSRVKEENNQESSADSSTVPVRDSLKLELSVDVDLPERKRRISETSTGALSSGSSKSKCRRMDAIVSPVIPQPGTHKRLPPMGAQGAPHRNRQRTYSVQSTESEEVQAKNVVSVAVAVEESKESGNEKEEDSEANKSSDSIKTTLSSESGKGVGEGSQAGERNEGQGGETATGEDAPGTSSKDQSKMETKGEVNSSAGAASESGGGVAKPGKGNDKKKPKNVFQFGNYDRYYGYRNLNEMTDVRLHVFKQNQFLFKDKDVLDIGCNVGQLTMAVAKSLGPRSVLGIDIDSSLIKRAKRNLSLFIRVPDSPPKTEEEEGESTVAEIVKEETLKSSSSAKEETTEEPEKSTEHGNSGNNGKRRKRGRRRGGGDGGNARKSADPSLLPFADPQRIEFFPQSFPLCYGLIPDLASVAKKAAVSSSTATTATSSTTTTLSADVTTGSRETASAGASSMTPTMTSSLVVATGPKSTDDQQETKEDQKKEKEKSASGGGGRIGGMNLERVLFPKNIRFISGNYVLKTEQQLARDERHKYDLIMCLSVTKWVHLNYGDVGLKMMFRRIFNQLRPGGKFILEAQNWMSYTKKKKLTERIFRNFQQIEFYPRNFHEYLLSPEVGFSHSYPLGVPRHLSKGFCRPIQLYVKGDFTPSQVMWSEAHHPPQTPYTPYRGIYAEMMCPPPRGYNPNSSVWGGGDNTPFRPMASTSQYYNPMETDSYLPSYETEVSNRRYCFQSPLYSSEWSPPPMSSSNSETRTPPKPSTPWSSSNTPMTPAMTGGGSVTNTPHHRHVYPPDEPLLEDLENTDSQDPQQPTNNGGATVSQSGDTPRTEEDSPEH